jgi:diguanylate cyclase (GGDEF)-like protein/PAS domain S-box-containing protein
MTCPPERAVDPTAVLDALPDSVFVIDADARLRYANQAAERVFGWKAEDWIGKTALDLVHPDDLEMALVSVTSVQEKGLGSPIQIRLQTSDGWKYFELQGQSSVGTADIEGIVLVARDTTERRRFEVAGDELERLSAMVHNAASILLVCDRDGAITDVSGALVRLVGRDPEYVIGQPLADLAADGMHDRIHDALQNATRTADRAHWFEADLRKRGGGAVPFEFHVVNLLDDPVVGALVVSAHDITELRETQKSLEHLATHDPLTKLANRTLLMEQITSALGRTQRRPDSVAVLFCDLDRFKPVNDLHGHESGDELLCEVARRLALTVRPGDVVARLGGDEFVVLAEPVNGDRDAAAISRRIEAAIAEPFELSTGTVQIFASVGHAVAENSMDAESLLAEADASMYAVKTGRRGQDRRSVLKIAERRSLAGELAAAIEAGDGVEVHYQPVVALSSGHLTGFEALVRWRHPREGLLLPARFLGVAEEAGLDIPLGVLVLNEAVGQLALWDQAMPGNQMTMAVNVSAAQLIDDAVDRPVAAALAASGVDPGRVVLEVTEHTLLERPARGTGTTALAALTRLKALGVKLAIDDFGTGYSSLTHVRTFPVDVLKADRSFVKGMGTNPQDTDIVAAVVALGHAMGMTIVAEGVTDGVQESLLQDLGCDLAQGFLYGAATPGETAGLLVAQARRRTQAGS